MIDMVKMGQAWHWFENAMRYEMQLNGETRSRMISMALNKACILELEALGFHVHHQPFMHRDAGEILAVHTRSLH